MSTEALVLALTARVRPTSAAAVFAMLSTPRPQRLLVAYLVVGLGFSLAVGTLVVVLLGRPAVDARVVGGPPAARPRAGNLRAGLRRRAWIRMAAPIRGPGARRNPTAGYGAG